ncbi:MAG: hypothetical protein NT126_07835 [Bacteroidetes bacterium]|nr:hypothetical protein [Bacteroidota bacterium]
MIKKYSGENPFLFVFAPFISCFVLFGVPANAQKHYGKIFRQLSCPEKRWVIFHPFVAKKAYRLTQQARTAAKEMVTNHLLDDDENGGQADAFRHSYWMALLSQHICWRKAMRLGKAHEKGNYLDFKKNRMEEGSLPDSVSGAMDLYNNEIGIAISRRNHGFNEKDLIQAVRDSILAGKMIVIRKNKKGEPLDCEGRIIELKKYQHQWNIPKCLVHSDSKEP